MRKSFTPTILSALLTFAVAVSAFGQKGNAWNAGPSSSAGPLALERAAQSALKQGNFQEAIRKYAELVKASPHSADYRFQLGAAYYGAGDPRAALSSLREALRLKPGLADARYLLGASLAETGGCEQALPGLKRAVIHVKNSVLQRRIGIDGVNCSMELNRQDDAIDFLQRLRRKFPKNAEVLYLSVHVFSDLSTRASQTLLTTDPGSYQVHELYAESLESQGKWDQAEAEYKKVLQVKPGLPGIHFLIGRLILTKPKTATTFENAKKEFEAELKVDPHNAGAEFVLGKLALRIRDYETAIARFSKAAAYDPNFPDAKIELGRALISIHQPAKAVAPLESAVKLEPQNPSAHYLLAMAYRGTGRLPDAQKQLVAYQQATKNTRRSNQDIRSAITGRESPAQLSEQNEHPKK